MRKSDNAFSPHYHGMFTACSAHIHRMFTACSFRLVAVTFWIFADQADLTRIKASAGLQSWVTLMLADSRGDLGGQAAGTRSILVAGRRRALQCWKAWRAARGQNSSAGKRLFIAELATAQRDLEMLVDSVGPRCAPSKTPDFKLKNRTNVGIL